MTAPILLGHGKPLFAPGSTPAGMFKLIEHRVTRNGIAMDTYEPAGPVQAGSFATPDPSKAELERRERLRREGAAGG